MKKWKAGDSSVFRIFLDHSSSGVPHEIHIVGGPRPYVWIGSESGYYGSISNKLVRKFRDELTKALRGT